MRIMWYSNAPWAKSGYANQTRLALQALTAAGHQCAVACNFGLRGGTLDSGDGTRFYPQGSDRDSNDIIAAHCQDFKADVLISLYDAWTLKFSSVKIPWIAWTPVDHQPVPEIILDALRPATRVVAYSKFGRDEFRKAGVDSAYIPHGVDTKIFAPQDKQEARARLGLPLNKFLVGMVGTNIGYPSRKCIPQALQAFAQFHREHLDSALYLHTEQSGISHGLDIKQILKALELGPDAVLLCDQYHYANGFPDAYLVDVYSAIDVLLSPSMGEGFGLPILEAQACGTPVIVNDFSAMPELCGAGWKITELEQWWEPQGSWMVIPHIAGIVSALEYAHNSRLAEGLRISERARAFALGYDFSTVVGPQWNEFLAGIKL